MASQTLLYWIFTAAQILFWIYLVSCFSGDVYFNLYVNRARTFLFKPITWVQSILPRFPEWGAAALLFLFVTLLHAAFSRAGGKPMDFTVGLKTFSANLHSLPAAAIFGLAAFSIVIGQVNLVRMGMELRHGRKTRNGVIECLDTVCWPLSIPPAKFSAPATAGTLFAATLLIAIVSGSINLTALQTAPALQVAIAMGKAGLQLTLFAIIDVLVLLRSAVVALVILSIGGLVTGKLPIMGMANEWLNGISRIFLRNPITVGMFDLTPLLIYYLASFVHGFLVNAVVNFF